MSSGARTAVSVPAQQSVSGDGMRSVPSLRRARTSAILSRFGGADADGNPIGTLQETVDVPGWSESLNALEQDVAARAGEMVDVSFFFRVTEGDLHVNDWLSLSGESFRVVTVEDARWGVKRAGLRRVI